MQPMDMLEQTLNDLEGTQALIDIYVQAFLAISKDEFEQTARQRQAAMIAALDSINKLLKQLTGDITQCIADTTQPK